MLIHRDRALSEFPQTICMSRNWCEVLNFIFHFAKTFYLPENHLGKMNKCKLEAFFINSLDPASVVHNLESTVVLLDKSQLN